MVDPLKYGRSWPWGRRSPYAGSLQWDAFVGFQKLTAETTWLKSPLEANPISLRSFSHTSQLLPRNTPYNRLLLGSLYPTGSPPGWRPAIFHCSSWKTYMLPNSGSADSSRRGPPHSEFTGWSEQPPTFHSHQAGSKHQVPLMFVPKLSRRHIPISLWILSPCSIPMTGHCQSLQFSWGPPHKKRKGNATALSTTSGTLFNSHSPASAGGVWWRQ